MQKLSVRRQSDSRQGQAQRQYELNDLTRSSHFAHFFVGSES